MERASRSKNSVPRSFSRYEPLDEEGHGSQVKDLIGFLGYEINVFENGEIRKRKDGEFVINYVLTPA